MSFAMPVATNRQTALVATAVLVKGATGELYGYHVQNPNAADAYLQFYDAATAGAVTVGTTTPKLTFWIPASSGDDDPGIPVPVGFTSGIVIAATTTATGSTPPTVGLLVNTFYR